MKDTAFHQLSERKFWNKIKTVDVSCQSNQKQYRSAICTCRRRKKTQIVHRDNNSEQSSIELGVERVKVVSRKKIIVNLPENKGVLNIIKKISSKCVGFVPDHSIGENLNNIQKKDTSNEGCEFQKSKIKRSDLKIKKDNISKRDRRGINIIKKLSSFNKEANRLKNNSLETKKEKSFSSNSSIERIYNLESSTSDNSKIVSVSNEDNFKGCNSLSLKNNSKNSRSEKPSPACLRSPIFENNILKQGLSWVRESSKDLIVRVNLSKTIHKDVSITCSPPSLIARSLSSTKVLSKKNSFVDPSKIEVLEDLNNKEKCTKEESKAEDVKTMFSLWEKKFNFEDVPNQIENNTIEENDTNNMQANDSKDTSAQEHKKSKKIFSFFRKKNKDKNVNSFKGKKVTAGRCELSDGIVIKIALDKSRSITSNGLKKAGDTKDDKNILQQSWLKKFITNSGDSRKSVQLRWDNKLYGTSSNTVSELKNYTYKESAITFNSKSDIKPNAFLQYDKRPNLNVNFKQDIKACMMPNTICQIPVNTNSSFSSNCKKLRGKSKHHIEIFLPTRHFSRNSNKSSNYITIHIPEEYFSENSEDQNQYTDEEVYNIVEYEPQKSKNVLKDEKFYTGDYLHNNTKDKRQTTVQTCKEVVVQGSNVCVPKVIEVSVITQKDMNCHEKSMEPEDNRNESQHLQPQRKCDLAETYLRDYCRNVMPLGLDPFTSHMSKSQWQLISLNSSDNCSNCDLCIDNNKLSSKSLTEKGSESSKIKECKQIHTNHFFSKLRKKTCSPLPPCNIRTCPKDSIEVCKKRKIYACSNKSKWGNNSTDEKIKTDIKKSSQSTASSEDNCIDPCSDSKDGPLGGILKFKGISDCSNCKNNENVTKKTATVIPNPICQIPQPPCIEKCASVKNPICTKTSSPTCHARTPECNSPKSKISQTEPSEPKVTQTKSPQVTPSSSHAICLNAVDSDAKRDVDAVSPITCFCSGDDDILPISESVDLLKKTLTGSDTGHYIPPTICPIDPNSYCCCKPNCNSITTKSNAKLSSPCENKNTTTTFYQKSLVNAKRIRCNCIGKRNVVTSKCAPDDPNCNTNTDTKKGSIHLLSEKPLTKSSKQSKNETDGRVGEEGKNLEIKESREIRNEKGEEIDNKTSVTSKLDSTKENTNKSKGVNCDEILSTKEKTNKTEEVNCDEILKDVYKDPCDVIKTPTQEAKEQKRLKSIDANTIQRKISVSDIIEINICLKFRNPEASKVKIRPQYAYNVDEKSDIQNVKIGSSQIYQVDEREDNQIKGQTEDINFTINIQTVKPKCSLSNEDNLLYYTAKTFKRDTSINYSEHLLHDHQPALNLTNSVSKVTFVNKQIANFEMTCGTDNFTSSKTTNSSLINENFSENNSNITTDNISELSDIHSHYKQKVINDLQEEFKNTKDVLRINESIKDIVDRKLVSILKKLNKNEKKEVLKQILETVGNMKCKNKAKKVKRIKHLMYAVLTSESNFENINDVKSRSTSSTRRPLDNSSKSSFLLNEMLSENTTPTQENGSSESNDVRHVSSNMKEKIKRIIGYNRTGCCCSKKVDIEEKSCCCKKVKIETKNYCKNVESGEICCCHKKVEVSKEITEVEQSLSDQKKVENLEEKAIQDSKNSEMESIIMTEMSTTMHIESKIVSASAKKKSNFSSPFNSMRHTRQDNFVYLASDKVLFFLSDSKNNSRSNIKRKQSFRPENILQLRKTKRAVLKIYSQRRLSSSIIKLPKFVSHRQCIQPNQPI